MPPIQDAQLVEPVTSPQHYQPASARERRAQAIHRLQLGLLGLAAMLLIVGLANIIMDRARMTAADEPLEVEEAAATPSKASDPLADIGLVPSPEPSPKPTLKSPPTSSSPEAY